MGGRFRQRTIRSPFPFLVQISVGRPRHGRAGQCETFHGVRATSCPSGVRLTSTYIGTLGEGWSDSAGNRKCRAMDNALPRRTQNGEFEKGPRNARGVGGGVAVLFCHNRPMARTRPSASAVGGPADGPRGSRVALFRVRDGPLAI